MSNNKIEGRQEPDWEQFGTTPRYLAAGLRLRPELVLAYVSSTLGGLSGAFARMDGFLGERHHPALPLVLADRHPGRARHLERLFIEPTTRFDDWQRRKSLALDPELFDEHHAFQGSKIKQAHLTLMNELESPSPREESIAWDRGTLIRHRQERQPSVMLTSPEPKTFDQARGEVFDESPLIVDTGGRLVRNAIQPHPKQREWQHLLERIVEGARGGIDQPAGPGGYETLSSTRRTRTPFLIHLPAELTGEMLLHPASADIMEVGILLPTERIPGRLTPSQANYDRARRALGRYQNALNRVLWSRLDNSGVALALTKPIPALLEGQDELEDQLDGLPSTIRRYCGGVYGLPMRLLWTALVLDAPRAQNADKFVPGVLATARWCVDRQIGLVTEALEAEKRRELECEAVKMLRKLAELVLPCKLADLQRKYHSERKESLQPILHFLQAEQLASWEPDRNRIDLIQETPRPDWLDEHDPRRLLT